MTFPEAAKFMNLKYGFLRKLKRDGLKTIARKTTPNMIKAFIIERGAGMAVATGQGNSVVPRG